MRPRRSCDTSLGSVLARKSARSIWCLSSQTTTCLGAAPVRCYNLRDFIPRAPTAGVTMRITLSVETGPHAGKVFSFNGHDMFLVGRSKNAHFRFDRQDMYFSRLHFMVEVNPPLCRILDMNSRNGTYVNGQRVQAAELHDGDLVKAGHTTLRVALVPEPEAPSYPGGGPAEEELVPLLPVADGPTARPAPMATLAPPPALPSFVPPPPRPSTPPVSTPAPGVSVPTPTPPLAQTLPPSAGPALT